MFTTSTGHYSVKLKVKKKKDGEIMYLEEERDELSHCRAFKKVHEVNNYRSADQLIDAYSRAEWMIPKFSELTESSEEL